MWRYTKLTEAAGNNKGYQLQSKNYGVIVQLQYETHWRYSWWHCLKKAKKKKPLGQSADPSCIENAYNLLFKTAPPTFTHTYLPPQVEHKYVGNTIRNVTSKDIQLKCSFIISIIHVATWHNTASTHVLCHWTIDSNLPNALTIISSSVKDKTVTDEWAVSCTALVFSALLNIGVFCTDKLQEDQCTWLDPFSQLLLTSAFTNKPDVIHQ